ncbi:hypothetical protein JCM18237_08260 [Halorubrum luteum]
MASRQGGPGRDDAPGSGTTDPFGPESPVGNPHHGGGPGAGFSRSESDSSRRPPHGFHRQADSEASRRTASDPPLRDPELYALTDHFHERLGQPGRYVSTRTVSDAIRHGQLRWNRTDGWRFAVVRDGVRFVVVVSDTETASPVVVTAWTEIADRAVALASPRWDATDVDTIAVRTALSESSSTPIPDRLRPRDVSRPFVVGGHELETEPGEPFVRCTQCGRRFRSKDELTARRCRSSSGQ